MRLTGSETSPYVRKVRVQAMEGGYWEQLDFNELGTTPIDPNAGIANPLKKVPALELGDGMVLFDSRVICEYLDGALGDGASFPAPGPARWTALRRQALGDGLLDAALLLRYETSLRPAELCWNDWCDGQTVKIDGALADMEAQAADFGDTVDIGTITTACALGYLDFRYKDKGWRETYPALGAWYAEFSQRPSMTATVPPE
ncbi:MAG: glutathione S-transferase N-terminal domain-containing protein [Magnetovibrio sp.]|nr:glutathione S-transferase N-terminal domain-containing protein [Magnetovibrio sp.]